MNKRTVTALIVAISLCGGTVFASHASSPSPSAATQKTENTVKTSASPSSKKTDEEEDDSKASSSAKKTDEEEDDSKASPSAKATSSPKADKDSEKFSESGDEKKTSFPEPHAKSAIVIDANSGDVIYALNADDKVYPAGTSNIMTAIVALENIGLSDSCTVTEEALADITYDQPQLGMKVGEVFTVEQLLYAVITNSNNDAANTLAIAVSGNIDAFVTKMNEKAAEIGMNNTHFANPSGKQDENHYTTAADMAVLSRYAMKNTTFAQIASTQKYVLPATNMRSSDKTMLSTNHLVSRYKYPYHYYANATGVKSGNSKDAGYCLCASAVKGKLNLISVVMGCENTDVKDGAYSFTDTAKMFDYVFENYQSVLLVKKGDVVYDTKVKESKNSTRLALTVDDDIYATLKKTADPELITNEVNLEKEIKAPIEQGEVFGTVTYSYNGRELKKVNIVAANEVKRDFILHIINSVTGFIFNPIVLIIVILIAAFLIRLRIIRNRKRRMRQSKMAYYNRGGNSSARMTRNTRDSQTRRRNTQNRRRDY